MSRTCVLELSPHRRQTLTRVRDHHPKPHLREKAAALLKIADGWLVQNVAAFGLLRPRSRNTVSAWVVRYKARGLAGLAVRSGRGRKPAFSPHQSAPGPGATWRSATAEPP
jgi:transposase